ncbi:MULTISPECIES: EamA family transporter [unclassified Mesotoga]|uniref:EamA family transporter n=1 Tax=unclassified Mesotoga TaxID=1184398 RepID=UPI000E9EA742|nr:MULTISPECIES: EamA family transporter [unclassified Mesotoga]HAY98842.1 EamA family transporter [Mesotoga sp.]
MKRSGDGMAILAYVLVSFFWGSTYLAIKIGVEGMPPMFFAGVRFLIAGSIMLVFSVVRGHSFPSSKSELSRLWLVGLFMLLGGNGLVVYAEQWVDSGVASLIMATIPIFAGVLEHFFIRTTRLTLKALSGLLLGFFGVYFLLVPAEHGISIDIPGILMLLSASFLWSTGTVLSKTFKGNSSIVSNIGIQMFAGGVGLMFVSGITGEFSRVRFSMNSLLAIAYLVVFGSLIAYSSYIYLLQKWPATKAGTYAYINPLVAVSLGAIFLDEKINFLMILAMGAILLGVLIVQKSKIKVVG